MCYNNPATVTDKDHVGGKKEMISWKKAGLFFTCVLLLMTGCGKEAEDTDRIEVREIDSKAGTGTDAQERKEASDEEAEMASSAETPRELTVQELRDFSVWIDAGDNHGNYGFLLSEYDRPQDVDLDQVFYTGAGLPVESMSPEEEQAYLKATGQEEIYTDTTRLTTEDIKGFLEKKLGTSYEEMTRPLSWTYLPEYDIYIHEHGDTNYMNFTCVSGRLTEEGLYELECVPGDTEYVPEEFCSRLTLKKNGSDWQFVSNTHVEGLNYSMDIWKIDEQCFDTELEGWGEVTFTSYAPAESAYGNQDVCFKLLKDDQTVYQFPPVEEGNYRYGKRFQKIEAVSFQDYNNDGNRDVILIIKYEPFVSDDVNPTEVRLYRNRPETRDFLLDTDKMDFLNINRYNNSIQEVLEHIDGGKEE